MDQDNTPTRFQPLYIQAKEHLIQLIVDGRWAPGALLPSENQLAKELGISQGTVRKALDEMTAEKLVIRRQGRGTFVAEHTQEQALFHFFRLADAQGEHPVPSSEVLSVDEVEPTASQAQILQLDKAGRVIRITRVRELAGERSVVEEIVLSAAQFPQLVSHQPLPNTLYTLYQREYGLSVLRAEEHLSAVEANSEQAALLDVEEGHPLLRVERIAFAIDGRPIEIRYSYCLTDRYSYQVNLI